MVAHYNPILHLVGEVNVDEYIGKTDFPSRIVVAFFKVYPYIVFELYEPRTYERFVKLMTEELGPTVKVACDAGHHPPSSIDKHEFNFDVIDESTKERYLVRFSPAPIS